MTPKDARYLLSGYSTGTLTKTEREALARAVLEDPALFEEFVEEEDWRGALADPAFRQRLQRRLRDLTPPAPVPWIERLGLVFRYRWITVATAAAALATIALIRQGVIGESSPVARVVLGPDTIPALHAAGLLEPATAPEKRLESESQSAPPARAKGAALSLDRRGSNPVYTIGGRLRIGFRVPADGNVLLIEERAAGEPVRLFPNRFQSSSAVRANRTMLVPPAGQGDLEVDGPPGPRTLRLLVFPAGVDPLAEGIDWQEVREQAQVVERTYEVKP